MTITYCSHQQWKTIINNKEGPLLRSSSTLKTITNNKEGPLFNKKTRVILWGSAKKTKRQQLKATIFIFRCVSMTLNVLISVKFPFWLVFSGTLISVNLSWFMLCFNWNCHQFCSMLTSQYNEEYKQHCWWFVVDYLL